MGIIGSNNIVYVFCDIALFLLGLYGIPVFTYLYNVIGKDKMAGLIVLFLAVVIICFRYL